MTADQTPTDAAQAAADTTGAPDTTRTPRNVVDGPGRSREHKPSNKPLGARGEPVPSFNIRMPKSVYTVMYEMADADDISAAELVRRLIMAESGRREVATQ